MKEDGDRTERRVKIGVYMGIQRLQLISKGITGWCSGEFGGRYGAKRIAAHIKIKNENNSVTHRPTHTPTHTHIYTHTHTHIYTTILVMQEDHIIHCFLNIGY